MNLKKTIKIHTNDPLNRIVHLMMKGDVSKFVRLEPKLVSLKGKAGDKIAGQIKIIPAAIDNFTITKTFVKSGNDITFDLKKIQNNSGMYYLLTVHNQRQTPGRYFDLITAQTDTIPSRSIKIRISGNLTN